MFTHIVFFKFKDEKFSIEAKKILDSMSGKIGVAKEIEVGIDVLKIQRSFHLALIVRFDKQEDLEVYTNHPYHLEVINKLKDQIIETKSVDF